MEAEGSWERSDAGDISFKKDCLLWAGNRVWKAPVLVSVQGSKGGDGKNQSTSRWILKTEPIGFVTDWMRDVRGNVELRMSLRSGLSD